METFLRIISFVILWAVVSGVWAGANQPTGRSTPETTTSESAIPAATPVEPALDEVTESPATQENTDSTESSSEVEEDEVIGETDIEASETAPLNFVDMSQEAISKRILDISNRIDAFFSDERMMEEAPGTYGCIRANAFYEQGGDYTLKGNVCLKVDLPNTQRRWKLFIDNRDTEDEAAKGEGGQASLQEVTEEETTSTTGFRYIAEETVLKRLSFDIGVKSRLPLDPFTRLRWRYTWTPDIYLLRLTETLYYYKSIEGGLSTRLDVERPLSKIWYARFTSEADYRDEESQFRLKQVFGVYRKVGKGKALNLELIIRGNTQPNAHLEYYLYRLRYRFNAWRDWFFVEVAPQVLYETGTNFENVPGIQLSAEAVFGNF